MKDFVVEACVEVYLNHADKWKRGWIVHFAEAKETAEKKVYYIREDGSKSGLSVTSSEIGKRMIIAGTDRPDPTAIYPRDKDGNIIHQQGIKFHRWSFDPTKTKNIELDNPWREDAKNLLITGAHPFLNGWYREIAGIRKCGRIITTSARPRRI